jgi:hypothetical protein
MNHFLCSPCRLLRIKRSLFCHLKIIARMAASLCVAACMNGTGISTLDLDPLVLTRPVNIDNIHSCDHLVQEKDGIISSALHAHDGVMRGANRALLPGHDGPAPVFNPPWQFYARDNAHITARFVVRSMPSSRQAPFQSRAPPAA